MFLANHSKFYICHVLSQSQYYISHVLSQSQYSDCRDFSRTPAMALFTEYEVSSPFVCFYTCYLKEDTIFV